MLFLGHNTNGKLFQLLLFTSKLLPPFLLQETHEISLSSDKSSSAGKYYIYEKTNDYTYEIKMIWNVSCFTCSLLAYTKQKPTFELVTLPEPLNNVKVEISVFQNRFLHQLGSLYLCLLLKLRKAFMLVVNSLLDYVKHHVSLHKCVLYLHFYISQVFALFRNKNLLNLTSDPKMNYAIINISKIDIINLLK